MEKLGYERPTVTEIPKRLIASVSGLEKTGKTHLALSAPEPVYYLNFDLGLEGVLEKFLRDGRDIWVYQIKNAHDMTGDAALASWDKLKDTIRQTYESNQGTLVVDTGTEFWELLRMARLGKLTQVKPQHYGLVNGEMREVIRWAYAADQMSTIFVHKLKDEWVAGADGSSRKSGKKEVAGFGEMAYMVQANLETYARPDDGVISFGTRVKDCRQNPMLYNMEFEGVMSDYTAITEAVHDL